MFFKVSVFLLNLNMKSKVFLFVYDLVIFKIFMFVNGINFDLVLIIEYAYFKQSSILYVYVTCMLSFGIRQTCEPRSNLYACAIRIDKIGMHIDSMS